MACYLLTDHMSAASPNRYEYLWEMGGLAGFADLLLPARHGIASPRAMPRPVAGQADGRLRPGQLCLCQLPDSGEAYRGRRLCLHAGCAKDGFGTL